MRFKSSSSRSAFYIPSGGNIPPLFAEVASERHKQQFREAEQIQKVPAEKFGSGADGIMLKYVGIIPA